MKSPTIGAAMLTVSSDKSFSDEELTGKKRDQDAESATREAADKAADLAEPRDPDSKPAEKESVKQTNPSSSNA